MAHKPAEWAILFSLAIMWGSAFLLTKVAVGVLPPATLVASRLVIAALILLSVSLLSRQVLKSTPAQTRFFIVMAVIGNCLPFFMISWGQQWIDSSVAGMLMATMPMVTIVLAHLFLKGELLTGRKIFGFFLGFVGVVILLGPKNLLKLGGSGRELIGQFAVLGGALSYACAAIIARRGPALEPLKTGAGVTSAASLIMIPAAYLADSPYTISLSPEVVLSVLALGAFSTALATLLYFRLIKTAGPGFLAMINYLIPLWAAFLGAAVLDERLSLSAWVALGLILFGMFFSQSGVRAAATDTSAGHAGTVR